MPNSLSLHSLQRTISYFALAAGLLLIVSCQGGTNSTSPPSKGFMQGGGLFNEKCQKCHGVRRTLTTQKDEETWVKTILRMQEKEKSDISSEQLEKLVQYHVERQKRENALFQDKCQKCHPGNRFIQKAMTPEQARTVIKTMQEKAGNTIRSEDVELIINYHIREHNLAVQQGLSRTTGQALGIGSSVDPKIITLFVSKCSSCHEPERSMYVFKDKKTWSRTLRKMQAYSRGFISTEDTVKLVSFHVRNQKNSMEIFKETCTECHTSAKIFQRSMTDEQWRHTIREMQKKSPDLISEGKIDVLLGFIQRFEQVIANIFEGQCSNCHLDDRNIGTVKAEAQDSLIVLVNERFTTAVSQPDVQTILNSHKERENRQMSIFTDDCTQCHPDDQPRTKRIRSRDEWTKIIATKQDKTHNNNVARSINTQIKFHIADQRL
ncbi:hypothetical protein ACFL6N_01490 [Thermodesulfobacteriota bacterium]